MFQVLVATVIKNNSQILLVEEQKQDVKGLLNLPAGHLEKGESLIQAAKRETKEETGLDIDIVRLIDTKYFSAKGNEHIAFIFKGIYYLSKLINMNLNINFTILNISKVTPNYLEMIN